MNSVLKERQNRLLRLQKQLRVRAVRLIQTNAQKIADHRTNLMDAVRHGAWAQAALFCAKLFRLIQIQIEAERLLSRYRNERSNNGHRR